MTSPTYSRSTRFGLADLAARLGYSVRSTDHAFWPDSISLRDGEVFSFALIISGTQIPPGGRCTYALMLRA